jgi:hypothetical protein
MKREQQKRFSFKLENRSVTNITYGAVVLPTHDPVDLSDRMSDLICLQSWRVVSLRLRMHSTWLLRLTSPAPGDGSDSLINSPWLAEPGVICTPEFRERSAQVFDKARRKRGTRNSHGKDTLAEI